MGQESARLLEAFYQGKRSCNLSEKTLDSYAQRLVLLPERFSGREITDITADEIRDYVASIDTKFSPATINGQIRVFRLFFRWLKSQGIIDREPTKEIPLLRQNAEAKQTLTPSEIGLILSTFDRATYEGNRNFVMFLTMCDSTIRVYELVRIKLSDLNLERQYIMTFRSKGREYSEIRISSETAKHIDIYLTQWRRSIPGELVFPNVSGAKLREDSAYHILQRAGDKVGIRVYPQMLRRAAPTM